jgi:hypothetical protein
MGILHYFSFLSPTLSGHYRTFLTIFDHLLTVMTMNDQNRTLAIGHVVSLYQQRKMHRLCDCSLKA